MYSPDLSLCDFLVSGALKWKLQNRHVDSDVELVTTINCVFQDIPPEEFHKTMIAKWKGEIAGVYCEWWWLLWKRYCRSWWRLCMSKHKGIMRATLLESPLYYLQFFQFFLEVTQYFKWISSKLFSYFFKILFQEFLAIFLNFLYVS